MTLIDLMKLNKGIKIDMKFGKKRVEARFLDVKEKNFYLVSSDDLPEEDFKISMNIVGFILEIPLKKLEVEESDGIYRITARVNGKVRIIERRKSRRYPCFIPCDMMGKRCVILDISDTGFKMLARSFYYEGAIIALNDGSRGIVVWEKGGENEPREYGVYLLKVSKQWRKLVRNVRSRYLEILRRIGEW